MASPRAMWKGAIAFGMVSIPIKVAKATEEHDLHFNLLHKTDHSRVKQVRTCIECGMELDWDDCHRGYEITPGEFVIMEKEDFSKVQVESDRCIQITKFVPIDSIDPVFFENAYFLEPEAVGRKAFALLRAALADGKYCGIARMVMSQREQMVAIRVYHQTLMMETLRYPDEVRQVGEGIDEKLSSEELELAGTLVEALRGEFKPEEYTDRYREGLLELINAKAAGQEIRTTPTPTSNGAATDLMAALKASVLAMKPVVAEKPKRGRKAAA